MSSDLRRERGALARNFALGVGAQGAVVLGSGALNLLMARALGPEGFGAILSMIALATLAMTVASVGIHTGLNVVVLRAGEAGAHGIVDYAGNVLLIQLACLTPVALVLAAGGWGLDVVDRSLFIGCLVYAFFVFMSALPRHVFLALGRFDADLRVLAARPLLILLFAAGALWMGGDRGAVVLCYVLGAGAACFMAYWMLRDLFVEGLRRAHVRTWPVILREAFPFLGIAALIPVYRDTNVVLVNWMVGEEQAGVFLAAFKLVALVVPLAAAFELALFPRLQDVVREDPNRAVEFLGRVFRMALLVAVTLSALAFVYAPDIIQLAYGEDYAASGTLLRVMAIAISFRIGQRLWSTSYVAHRREKTVLVAMGGIVLGGLALSAVLVYRYGALGAALGTTIIEAAFFIGYSLHGTRLGMLRLGAGAYLRLAAYGVLLTVLMAWARAVAGSLLSLPLSAAACLGLVLIVDRDSAYLAASKLRALLARR